jgi:hypothetical protein
MRLDSTLKKSSQIYLGPKYLDTILMQWISVILADNFQIREHSWPCLFHISWMYNYQCNRCLSPLPLWFESRSWRGILHIILCDEVCYWLAEGWWSSPGTLVYGKTDRHDNRNIVESGVKHHNHNPNTILVDKLEYTYFGFWKPLKGWAIGVYSDFNRFCHLYRNLALYHSNNTCWSSTKWTPSSSSYRNVTCSRDNKAELLLIWR